MIEIKNISKEHIEITDSVDTSVAGCRIKQTPFGVIKLAPGETIAFLGYEPGVSHVFRPALNPEQPRNGTDEHVPYAEKAEADFNAGFDGQIAT